MYQNANASIAVINFEDKIYYINVTTVVKKSNTHVNFIISIRIQLEII